MGIPPLLTPFPDGHPLQVPWAALAPVAGSPGSRHVLSLSASLSPRSLPVLTRPRALWGHVGKSRLAPLQVSRCGQLGSPATALSLFLLHLSEGPAAGNPHLLEGADVNPRGPGPPFLLARSWASDLSSSTDVHHSAGRPPLPRALSSPAGGTVAAALSSQRTRCQFVYFPVGAQCRHRVECPRSRLCMGSITEDAYWGWLLGLISVEGRGQKQMCAEGGAGL